MNYYSVIPTNLNHESEQASEIINQCGSLFPFIDTKTSAISYAKSLKKQYPNVIFNLYVGKTYGELELVKQF